MDWWPEDQISDQAEAERISVPFAFLCGDGCDDFSDESEDTDNHHHWDEKDADDEKHQHEGD